MTRFTDGKYLVELEMVDWNGNGYSPDWSADFFEFQNYDNGLEAYVVDDVDYCIDMAKEYSNGEGEWAGTRTEEEIENSYVFYTKIPIQIIKSSAYGHAFATDEICKAIDDAEAYVKQETGKNNISDRLIELLEENQGRFYLMDTEKINDFFILMIKQEAKEYVEYIKKEEE